MLTLAAVADRENDLALTPDLLALARKHVEDRAGVSAEAESLLAVLTDRLIGAEEFIARPGDLGEPPRIRLGWRDAPTPELVGAWLRRLGFRRGGRDRVGAWYQITAPRLREVTDRHITVTPPPSHGN